MFMLRVGWAGLTNVLNSSKAWFIQDFCDSFLAIINILLMLSEL